MEDLFGDDTSTTTKDFISNSHTVYPHNYPSLESTSSQQPDYTDQRSGTLKEDDDQVEETTEKPVVPAQDIIVGIDLGTTFSCVAVWENGRAVVVANNMGNRTTPSWVCFHKEGIFVGEAAKSKGTRFPKLAVFDAKRMIGRKVHSTK